MKIKQIFTIIFILGFSLSSQAQFWKKLEKKAKEKIEREADRRAERRVNKKIDKVFDTTEDGIDGIGKNKKTKKIENLPANYNFEWEYTLKMESAEAKKKNKDMGDMKVVYYLNPNSSAFATKFEMSGMDKQNEMMGNMITIVDLESGVNIMLMEMNGQKIIQQMPSVFNQDIDESLEEQESKDYTIIKTDTKIISGYSCQGFRMTTNDGVINTYIAKNAPVSFNNTMSGNSKFQPKGFDPKWLKEFGNGLMMEMDFKSSKKEKYNMKMTCISLEKKPLNINLNEYKSSGF